VQPGIAQQADNQQNTVFQAIATKTNNKPSLGSMNQHDSNSVDNGIHNTKWGDKSAEGQ